MKVRSIITRKAGLLPYYLNDKNEPVFMFMVPSNPLYGGSDPSIAKGNIDEDETAVEAAIREASEELGLRRNNLVMTTMVNVWSGKMKDYPFTVYACQIKNKKNFDVPHYETGKTFWLTADEFSVIGRKLHLKIVLMAESLIMRQLKLK